MEEKDLAKYVNKIKRSQNWIFIVSSYLDLAKIGAEELIKRLDQPEDKKHILDGNIIIAIFYNIKHSLETTVKYLIWTSRWNEETEEILKTHDLAQLLNALKRGAVPKIKKPRHREMSATLIDKLQNVSEKYITLSLIHSKIKEAEDFFLYDPTNTFFRYPEHTSIEFVLNFDKITSRFTKEDFQIIIKDIEEIEGAGATLESIFRENFRPVVPKK